MNLIIFLSFCLPWTGPSTPFLRMQFLRGHVLCRFSISLCRFLHSRLSSRHTRPLSRFYIRQRTWFRQAKYTPPVLPCGCPSSDPCKSGHRQTNGLRSLIFCRWRKNLYAGCHPKTWRLPDHLWGRLRNCPSTLSRSAKFRFLPPPGLP